MTDAEIEQDGKKVKTNKGEVKITVKATLEKDYENRWEDRPLWKFLRSVYEKYIIRVVREKYEDDLEDKAKEYISNIKAFLQIPGR